MIRSKKTPQPSKKATVQTCSLGIPGCGLTGVYSTDGRVVFDARPVNEWEFMATGTGVTGLTVTFPDEMLIQVNHSSSLDEHGQVKALSRLHLSLGGSPFAAAKSFRMETDFRCSAICAAAQTDSGRVRMEIRAHVPLDAFRLDIFDERAVPGALSIRFEEDAPSIALASGNGLLLFHENPATGTAINSSNRHWLAGRTFGVCVQGGTHEEAPHTGRTLNFPASSHHVLHMVGASERAGKDAFLQSVTERMRQLAALSRDEFVNGHEDWWRQFWARSHFTPDDPEGTLIRYRAAFDLFRYYTACCTSERRETPARFQIELFRYHLRQHVWLTMGICAVEMYQSVFGAMRTGDWETLRGELRFFKENLPFYQDQARRLQGVGGAFIPMGQTPWTTQEPYELSPAADDLCRVNQDVPYNGDNPAGPLFMLALACDYADLSGDHRFAEETLRPLATEVMEYFRRRYSRGDDGKIAFAPCNAGETWRAVSNPAEIVCAFRFALPRLIAVGEKHGWPKDAIAQWHAMLAAAPDIPRGRLKFDPAARDIKPEILPGPLLVPAQDMSACKPYVLPWSGGTAWYSLNEQQTELFAIWPTRLVLRDEAERRAARESYGIRLWPHLWHAWTLDVAHAACLGLRHEVQAWFDPHFNHTFVLPCGLARETAPENPACPGMPDYPSLQGMGTGIIPVLEMLLQDDPDLLVILPCWPMDVPVDFTLYSPYAGRVEVHYVPGAPFTVVTDREINLQAGLDGAAAPALRHTVRQSA